MSGEFIQELSNKLSEQRRQLHGLNKAILRSRRKLERALEQNEKLLSENRILRHNLDSNMMLRELRNTLQRIKDTANRMVTDASVNTEMAHDVIKAARRWAAGKTEDELKGEREIGLFQAVGWLPKDPEPE